jgi:hypothetical protein
MKTITLFLASSIELNNNRDTVSSAVLDLNYQLPPNEQFRLIKFENFPSSLSDKRKQELYNESIRNSDLFLMLYWRKVGEYTFEEYKVALESLKVKNKPLIYLAKKKSKKIDDSVKFFEEKIPHDNVNYLDKYSKPIELKGLIKKELLLYRDSIFKTISTKKIFGNRIVISEIFKSREEYLQRIENSFNAGKKITVVNGEGGIGKSSVLSKYIDFTKNFNQFYWISFSDSIVKNLYEEFFNKEKTKLTDKEKIKLLIRSFSNFNEPTLILLDNINVSDQIDLIFENFKDTNVHFLLSKRSSKKYNNEINVEPLMLPECINLFDYYCSKTANKINQKQKEDLINSFGCNTYMIILYAKYIHKISNIYGLSYDLIMLKIRNKEIEGKLNVTLNLDTNLASKKVLDHLISLYEFSKIDENIAFKTVLATLSIFPPIAFKSFFLEDFFDDLAENLGIDGCVIDTIIEPLADQGWLIGNDYNYKMSPLITDLLMYKYTNIDQYLVYPLKKIIHILENGDLNKIPFLLEILPTLLLKLPEDSSSYKIKILYLLNRILSDPDVLENQISNESFDKIKNEIDNYYLIDKNNHFPNHLKSSLNFSKIKKERIKEAIERDKLKLSKLINSIMPKNI